MEHKKWDKRFVFSCQHSKSYVYIDDVRDIINLLYRPYKMMCQFLK